MKILKKERQKKNKFTPLAIVLLVLLILYCLTILYSLFWSVLTSLKINNNVFEYSKFGFPNYSLWKTLNGNRTERRIAAAVKAAEEDGGALFYTYRNIWKYFYITVSSNNVVHMPRMYLNSFIYAFGSAFTSTFVPCVAAYLCARYNFKFSKIMRNTVIVVMIIPIIGSMPSEIAMAKRLGMLDTFWGLWIMKANFLGLYFLVFYDIFKAMPMAFTEAAKIDGATNMQILIQIGLPLAKNTISTVFLIRFVEFWNDYQTPMVFMSSFPTVAKGLNDLINGNLAISGTFNPQQTPARMAAVVMTGLPVLVLFLVFQNKLMSNLTMGGVKG